jgi:2'-5' RNA ligase
MPRLFIALDMPEEVASALDRLCTGLPAARWTDPSSFHLTVRFIGEVDHATFYDIGEALASISLPPFELALKGLGTFPPRGAPHTLWVGVDDPEKLQPLKRKVDRVLDETGIEREKRKFAPHVTLARFREPPLPDRFGSWVARRSLFRTQPFPVSSFNLYSSMLRPEGAEHYLEASYDFVTGVMERV